MHTHVCECAYKVQGRDDYLGFQMIVEAVYYSIYYSTKKTFVEVWERNSPNLSDDSWLSLFRVRVEMFLEYVL